MKLLNGPRITIPPLCLIVFLFIVEVKVGGQATSQRASETRGESGTAPAPAAPTPLSDQPITMPQHSLAVAKAGNGQGKVTNNPPGVTFKKGTAVVLHALPDSNSVFEAWGGNCSGSSRTCSVSMTADKTVTASFSLKAYRIHVRPSVNGVIHPFGSVKAAHGEKRRFQIIPLPGYRVSDVRVDKASVGATNSYTFDNVTSDHTIEAVFVKE
jgi:hypothetical protein